MPKLFTRCRHRRAIRSVYGRLMKRMQWADRMHASATAKRTLKREIVDATKRKRALRGN